MLLFRTRASPFDFMRIVSTSVGLLQHPLTMFDTVFRIDDNARTDTRGYSLEAMLVVKPTLLRVSLSSVARTLWIRI